MNTIIKRIGTYLPGEPVSNYNFASSFANLSLNPDLLNTIFGSNSRHIAGEEVQCSDLACNAANQILSEEERGEIDFMIFASASGDLIEPATGNIVQHKLGLNCPVMDVKNACNSFVSAIQVVSSFINQGIYKNVLIVSGEKLSNTIRYDAKDQIELKDNLAALSFGDAGCAMWLTNSTTEQGIVYQSFLSLGEHWDLSTVPGGGSMFPFDSDKNYFHGQTNELISILKDGKAYTFVKEAIEESPWSIDDVDYLITHQVAQSMYEVISKSMNLPLEKIHQPFYKFGNTAATSIPLSLHDAMKEGKVSKGDKVLLLGLAAGISVSVQMIVI